MYYWSKNTDKINLENEFVLNNKVKDVYIGTAYFSYEGLRILKDIVNKNGLKKNSVHVFLSDEFSQDKPYELLEELCKIAQVQIFFNHTFHAKVYLLKGSTNKVIYGSSNLTVGGFTKNIEFDNIEIVEGEKLIEIERFFKFCDFNAVEVTNDIIKYYKDIQNEIDEIRQLQNNVKKKLKGYMRQEDAINKDNYEIDDYYFDFSDYETFFERNETRDDADIRELRRTVQEKMLAIHEKVYPKIKKMGINCHWNSKHISSMIRPCEYNKGKVSWIGIRYGKSKREIDVLNQWLDVNEKDEVRGFQKHGCLQFCIVPDGFEINLFLAVRHDAIDKAHIQDKMQQLKTRIEKEIYKLKGYGMTWEIYNEETEEYHVFDIDNENSEKFCAFLQKYDHDGCISYLRLFYSVDDAALYDINTISNEVTDYITMLIPLYNILVWRPKV